MIDRETAKKHAELEAYRLLLQEALRVEHNSYNIYVHFGKVPDGNIVDPIPIDEYLDICIPADYMSPETILLVYEKCRQSLKEFKWGQ
tara:strand:+ start:175 stop:438 length:264 start_codon:yes stop_codon:yes gene_type:complete